MVGFRVEDPAPEAVFAYGQCVICDCGVPRAAKPRRPRMTCSEECLRNVQYYGGRRSMALQRRKRLQQTEKRCPVCKEVKPLDREHWDIYRGRWASPCKPCKRARTDAIRKRNATRPKRSRHQYREGFFVRMPAWPLGDLITQIARHEELEDANPFALGDPALDNPRFEMVCERVGVPERSVRAWRSGERLALQFDLADQALVRLGLLWWDVWNEETLRIPALMVRLYGMRLPGGGKRHEELALRGVRRHGDLGPDLKALETVRRAFEGP